MGDETDAAGVLLAKRVSRGADPLGPPPRCAPYRHVSPFIPQNDKARSLVGAGLGVAV